MYLSEPSIKPSTFLDTVRIFIKGPSSASCDEANPNIQNLLGDYAATEVFGTGAPYSYTTSISSAVLQSPTSAKVGIDNIWDNGWGTLYFIFDWSTLPGTVTPVTTDAIPGSDAGDLNPAYAGQTISVRAHSNGNLGSFSTCDASGEKVNLYMQLGVTATGWFGAIYTIAMVR